MTKPTPADIVNRIAQLENQLKTAQAKSTDLTDIDAALRQFEIALADIRKRGGLLEFAEPTAQADLINELIALAKSKGVTLSPGDAQLLITGDQVLKRLGYVAFAETAPSSPAAVASAAQALQAQASAKGQPISASEAVARVRAQQPTKPAQAVKSYRRGGPSIVDIPITKPW